MARTSTAAAEPVEETAEAEAPAVEKVSDEELLRRIQAEFANRPQRPRKTIQQFYEESIALVAAATGKRFRNNQPQVSEGTAVKVFELVLMWALNNRQDQQSYDILPPEGDGETAVEPDEAPPAVDEVIGPAEDQE